MTGATNARQGLRLEPSVLGVRQDQLNTDRFTGKATLNGALETPRTRPCQVDTDAVETDLTDVIVWYTARTQAGFNPSQATTTAPTPDSEEQSPS